MTATSSSTPQYHPFVRRDVDIGCGVSLAVSTGGFIEGHLAMLAIRAGGATFDASAVATRDQLVEYRDAINAVLVATDPA